MRRCVTGHIMHHLFTRQLVSIMIRLLQRWQLALVMWLVMSPLAFCPIEASLISAQIAQEKREFRELLERVLDGLNMESQRQVANFTEEELADIRSQFDQIDVDHNGHITAHEIAQIMKALGKSVPGFILREAIKEVDKNNNGSVEFDEFLEQVRYKPTIMRRFS